MKRRLDHHRPFVDLLDRVAIFARDDAAAYGRIRARLDSVREWYTSRADWPVVCTRELARLVKTPVAAGAGQGFTWVQKPLDYELFTWLLWYGESTGAEAFLLSQLVEEVEARAGELLEPGHLDWDDYQQRLSLNRVLKGLEAMGALRRVDGSLEEWTQDRSGDTLYEYTPLVRHLYVDRGALRLLGDRAALRPNGKNRSGDASAYANRPLPNEPFHNGEEGTGHNERQEGTGLNGRRERNGHTEAAAVHQAVENVQVPPEQRLYRSLLLSPALYKGADPEAFALLEQRDRRERIAVDFWEILGWDLEVTETYACLLRASATETSMQYLFPARGAVNHVLLILFGELQRLVCAGEAPTDAFDRVRLTRSRLTSILSLLREEHGGRWGKRIGRLSAAALTEEVLGALNEWELAEGPDADDQLFIMPLAARFRGAYKERDS